MKPVVHGLEDRYGEQVRFAYIDVDDPTSSELKTALGYSKQPEIYLLDGEGEVVANWSGFVDEGVLVSALDGMN
jgi:hypothetical protein